MPTHTCPFVQVHDSALQNNIRLGITMTGFYKRSIKWIKLAGKKDKRNEFAVGSS